MKRLVILALLCASPATAQVANPTEPSIGGLTREDARTLAAQGFTVSTSLVAVSANNYLNAALVNTDPARSLVMTSRVMSCSIAGVEYTRYASAATLPATPTPTAVTVGNRISGGVAIPATFSFNMSSSAPTGTISSGGFVPGNQEEKRIKDIVIIPPGGKLVYSLSGAGGGLAQTARCVMTFLGYVG